MTWPARLERNRCQLAFASEANRFEAPAVNGRGSQALERLVMLGRAVTLVRGEAVVGKDRIEADHHAIARDLGENRSGADADSQRVAIDDGLVAALHRQPRK